jgi:class 3 adenylate cyclase
MPEEAKEKLRLEIAHVLFIDIVGYSARLTDEQQALVDQLSQVVRGSDEFQKASATGRLMKIPTGDGMALIFYNSPEQPVECAVEISRVLRDHPGFGVRMGVHSGPVSAVTDVNDLSTLPGLELISLNG